MLKARTAAIAFFGLTLLSANLFSSIASARAWAATDVTADGAYVKEAELGPPVQTNGDSVAGWHDDATGINWAVVGSKGYAVYVFSQAAGSSQWHQEAEILSPDAAGAEFGASVAISGGTIAVGVPGLASPVSGITGNGGVYVFVRDPATGRWSRQALLSQDERTGARAGESVVLQGNTLFAGAPAGGSDARGIVWQLTRSGTTWSFGSPIVSSATAGSSFGEAIAIYNDRLIVGMPFDSSVSVLHGSAYIFRQVGSNWVPNGHVSPVAGKDDTFFGASVAIRGDIAVVGAPHDVDPDGHATGSATSFAFDNGGSEIWVPQSTLYKSDHAEGGLFGSAVALIDDSHLVVGVPNSGTTATTAPGEAVFYSGTPSAWTESDSLAGQRKNHVGAALAVSGNLVLSSLRDQLVDGAMTVFKMQGAHWSIEPSISGMSDAGENFGTSLAQSADLLVVSSPNGTVGTVTGSASIYRRDPDSIWRWEQDLPYPEPGISGTGFHACSPVAIDDDTVYLGLPDESSAQGAIHVFNKVGSVWTQSLVLEDPLHHAGDMFGCSISLSGDTMFVGAPGIASGKGGGYVFVRSGAVWHQQAMLTAGDSLALGISASLSGDTVVMGAPFQASLAGAAYVFTRSGTSWSLPKKITSPSAAVNNEFGASVATSGGTIAVGEPAKTMGAFASAGSVHLFDQDGVFERTIASATPISAGYFGSALAMLQDRLAIGEPGLGNVTVYSKAGTGWLRQSGIGGAGSGLGAAVALAGSRIAIGSPQEGANHGGRVYVFSDSDSIFRDGFE